MKSRMKKIVISGGGTGGHVFPAIAIADALRKLNPSLDILFVGAQSKLEMTVVPKAGYDIIGLDIVGIKRKLSWHNVQMVFKLIGSLIKAFKLIKKFKPDAVLGVGGYASGPVLRIAGWLDIPIFIQEQNSYPGITNRLMASKAIKIFVAFDGMKKYFNQDKIFNLGNPVRNSLTLEVDKTKAYSYLNLDSAKKTIGILGGSLGARTINNEIAGMYDLMNEKKDIQIIWQTGKLYWEEFKNHPIANLSNLHMFPFIDRMDYVYAISDVVITRAGAITLSELAIAGVPAILIPSPNVAEDHQTKNALALVNIAAAVMIPDQEVNGQLLHTAINLLQDEEKLIQMKASLKKFSKPNAADEIAKEILYIENFTE